jgi:hypothetical protein
MKHRSARHRSVIIPVLASNSLFLMSLGIPGLNKAALPVLLLVIAATGLVSCGSYNPSTSTTQQSTGAIKVRAFVSNPLFPNGTSTSPVLNVVDAVNDLLSAGVISVGATSPSPGFMVLFPNKRFTLVFSGSNNSISIVNNTSQSLSQNSSGTTISITLPGSTESIVVAPQNAVGFAAVPNAPIPGQLPGQPTGLVEVLDLSNNVITAGVPVPGARFLAQSHNGNRILVLGNRAGTVTMIAPSSIGTNTDPRTDIQSPLFDHPVWAVFSSDDSTAYILNCGPQCGGAAASVTLLDVNTNLAGPTIPVDAATVGLLSNSTLYVAGTKPGANTCAGAATPTLATTCGEVSVVDLGSMAVATTATITDGYHNHMEMGANGQLFIGAHTCTNINAPASGSSQGEIRGCLSIFDTSKGTVVTPAQNGDVTGIQPISHRNVVYVVQSGELSIYDTTTDKPQSTQVDIIGQAVDVKQVD